MNKKYYYTDLSEREKKQIYTRKQWLEKGYIPISDTDDIGILLWPTRLHTQPHQGVRYYTKKDVRRMTAEEKNNYRADKAKHRQELAQKNKAIQKQKDEEKYKEDLHRAEKEATMELQSYVLQQYAAIGQMMPQSDNSISSPVRSIVIDTETTGLDNSCDEILQLSILDADTGNALYNSYFHPLVHSEWADAEWINKISPAMVADKPYFITQLPKIQAIIAEANMIIGYNTDFDIAILKSHGIKFNSKICIIDIMEIFAEIFGERHPYYENYTWQSLETCLNYLQQEYPDNKDLKNITLHNSFDDCKVTWIAYKSFVKYK